MHGNAKGPAIPAIWLALVVGAGCYRHSGIPPIPATIPNAADSSVAALARALAPVLHVQRDEPFPLVRVVAVAHPSCPIIAYILDWKWDVHGQWLPWTKSSDEEEVWVGYDSLSHAPTDIWTYWHGTVLHADWRDRGEPAVSVQWGKHGTLPHGVIESDLPRWKTLNVFYAVDLALLPDIWMGKLAHGGPWGFFHGYARYRDFSRVVALRDSLSAVISAEDPRAALGELLGKRYSKKTAWPQAAGSCSRGIEGSRDRGIEGSRDRRIEGSKDRRIEGSKDRRIDSRDRGIDLLLAEQHAIRR